MGRMADQTILPLVVEKAESPKPLTAEDKEFITAKASELESADSMDALKEYGAVLKDKSQAVRNALRPFYEQRHGELAKQADDEPFA